MKLYPILPIRNNKGCNGKNTVLKEINSKIFSLFQYVNYFNPDFYEYTLTTRMVEGQKHLNISDLPLHGYYKISDSGVIDDTTGKVLEPGTLIVSYARAEGQLDNNKANIRNQQQFYSIQPFGGAAYYLISFDNNKALLSYDAHAQETYGLLYTFVFDTTNKRYFGRRYVMNGGLNSLNSNSKSLNLMASNGKIEDVENGYIVNQNENSNFTSLGTNDTNPLMYSFYYQPDEDENWNCEEIVFDSTGKTSSKLANTNIAIYTITRKDSSNGPCFYSVSENSTLSSVLQLEVG